MLIDAHHHLWRHNDRDYGWMNDNALAALRRDFLVSDLEEAVRLSGVSGTVAMQARQSIAETEFLLDVASSCSLVKAVVGWVPLCAADVSTTLGRFASEAKMKGVRHVLQDEPDPFFMLREDFNRGLERLKDFRLAYDILIFERQLAQTIECVDRHPQQVFVLDHLAKPKIKEKMLSPWAEQIRELARRENVYCKVSGMATEADWLDWDVDALRPYFTVVLEAFRPDRLMFGSDWPVVTLAGDYHEWIRAYRSLIADLSPDEQSRISSGTAREAYRIED